MNSFKKKNTSTSPAKLSKWDRQYVWHPFTQMQEWEQEDPLIIEKGNGVYLYDIHGNKYLDGSSSIWVNLHGHRHRTLDTAIQEQLGNIAHSTLLGAASPPSIILAKELVKIAPKGLTRVFYSDERLDGRGSGFENGNSILATAKSPAKKEKNVRFAWMRPITAIRWAA